MVSGGIYVVYALGSLRDMLTRFINVLLSRDADAVCDVAYGTVGEGWVDRCNG